MSIGYAEHLVEYMTSFGKNEQKLTLQPFELLDIAKCIQELIDALSASQVCPFCGTTDPEKHRCPDCKDIPCTCEDRSGHRHCPGSGIDIERFKKAIDVALSGHRPQGKMPSGLNREELRYFCLGVITEDDFEKGMPYCGTFDSHGSMLTQMYITDRGRAKVAAVRSVLGDWPNPT